jgi:competence protein ComEA
MVRAATKRRGLAAILLGGTALVGLATGVAFCRAPVTSQPSPSATGAVATAMPSVGRHSSKQVRPRLHLNTATSRELRQLPGVGELLAQRIIAGRPYRSLDELSRVKGLGKERAEAIKRVAAP